MPTNYNITKIQLPNGDTCTLPDRVKYIDVSKSGTTYSLPSGTTYASIKALMDDNHICILRVPSDWGYEYFYSVGDYEYIHDAAAVYELSFFTYNDPENVIRYAKINAPSNIYITSVPISSGGSELLTIDGFFHHHQIDYDCPVLQFRLPNDGDSGLFYNVEDGNFYNVENDNGSYTYTIDLTHSTSSGMMIYSKHDGAYFIYDTNMPYTYTCQYDYVDPMYYFADVSATGTFVPVTKNSNMPYQVVLDGAIEILLPQCDSSLTLRYEDFSSTQNTIEIMSSLGRWGYGLDLLGYTTSTHTITIHNTSSSDFTFTFNDSIFSTIIADSQQNSYWIDPRLDNSPDFDVWYQTSCNVTLEPNQIGEFTICVDRQYYPNFTNTENAHISFAKIYFKKMITS